MSASKDYRPDIDGLRAVAVLSVVLYHFDIGGLSGGFVGVDIFFVISGYLITKIIVLDTERNRFSYLAFYERRIRRLFPALFTMLAATLVAGALILLPHDLVVLANSALATLLFSSNILFWRSSGYFDASSGLAPLLHTWSLAVEEQFYLLYPLILVFLWRNWKAKRHILFLAAILFTLFATIAFQPLRPSATFYLSPFRAWELLTGALLAICALPTLRQRIEREVLAWAGLSLLLGSVFLISPGAAFPGWQAIVPVLGTALLIYVGGAGGSSLSSLLSQKPVVLVGLISYSLYLWHWPVVVYLKYLERDDLSSRLMALGLVFVVAYISYRWVEVPFRRKGPNPDGQLASRSIALGTGAAAVCIATAALALKSDNGHASRLHGDLALLNASIAPVIPFKACDGLSRTDRRQNECVLGDETSTHRVLVWGDSHALAWAPGLGKLFAEHGVHARLAFHSACPPLLGVVNPISFGCRKFNDGVLETIRNGEITHVMMIASWLSYSLEGGQYQIEDESGRKGNQYVFPLAFARTVEILANAAIPVTVVGPTPGAPDDVVRRLLKSRLAGKQDPLGRPCHTFTAEAAKFWAAVGPARTGSLQTVNPAPNFCPDTHARYLGPDWQLLYRDGGHLSISGAVFAADAIQHELLKHILVSKKMIIWANKTAGHAEIQAGKP